MKYLDEFQPDKLIDLKSLLQNVDLDLSRVYFNPDGGSSLSVELEIEPTEFLEFAENDLAKDDKQGLVNALTNAKRAIDGQIDKTFTCFGLKKKRNFPQKMAVLQEIGLLAPRIVNKVVVSRNLLEHQYKLPERSFVEDAVDIAGLFVFTLNSTLLNFCYKFYIGTYLGGKTKKNGDPILDKEIHVQFIQEESKFFLSGYTLEAEPVDIGYGMEGQKTKNYIGQSIVSADEPGYLQLLGIAGRSWHYDVEKNIAHLIEEVARR